MLSNEKLTVYLSSHFVMNLARRKMMEKMIIAIIKSGGVGQYKMAEACGSSATTESTERRIQRFFAQVKLDAIAITKFVLSLFNLPEKVVVVMDRTNWQFGKTDINILALAIMIDGVGVPIYWEFLPHRGNSNTNQRIIFMDFLKAVVPVERIKALLADREFIGQPWFTHLVGAEIPFCIRTRENMTISHTGNSNKQISLKRLFCSLGQGEIREIPLNEYGHKVRYVATRIDSGELLIVATSLIANGGNILKLYADRWSIESMFKALKSSGFNIEDTHIARLDRLNTLVGVMTIAYALSVKVGITKNRLKPIRIKTHMRRALSIFTYGFREIRRSLINFSTKSFNKIVSIILEKTQNHGVKYESC